MLSIQRRPAGGKHCILPPLEHFILSGRTRAAAAIHLVRAICRRAERRLVSLIRQTPDEVSPVPLAYLNRLGDLLFVLAGAANQRSGQPDVLCQRQK